MAREKQNYRENLDFLYQRYNKLSFLKKEVTDILDITYDSLRKMIRCGDLKEDSCGKIPIGSLASYLCG